jgi:AcrR family transcriptional regulator
MGVSERRAREREARKSSVLDATRSLFLEKGFNGTTTKQIASRCELSEATLFFYFKNKDEIITSLLFESIELWTDGLRKISKSTLSPEKKLSRLWRFFKAVKEGHPEYYTVYAYLARPNAMTDISRDLKDKVVKQSGESFELLAALLEEITGKPNGRLMADMLWATFLGLMVLRDSRNNLNVKAHPTDRDLTAIFDQLKVSLLT